MEKGRKTKVIAILALVVAVVGMSLGFAAFSNILTISSSATVTPNKEDFKMKIYGVITENEPEDFNDLSSYTSESTAIAVHSNSGSSGKNAIIDNNMLTISNLSAEFFIPDSAVQYVFIVKNEGVYDSYIKLYEYLDLFNGKINKTCSPGTTTTEELADKACEAITMYSDIAYFDNENEYLIFESDSEYFVDEAYKIAPGEMLFFNIYIAYDSAGARADGPFSVIFEDVGLKFSTVAK